MDHHGQASERTKAPTQAVSNGTAVQTIQKIYGVVMKVHAEAGTSKAVLAAAKAIAADPKLDKTLKPILSESGIDERGDNETAMALLAGMKL